ncbi:hypothetical protein [Streptomyces roseoviridis]|uniref:Phage tail protein n=1 Tax=Streptomyces roseoviridis TaxID=67361 RepID=A0ABV5QZ26_9ACTN
MAQWTLSVDLRGQGRSLAQTLRQNASHARTLGTAVRRTQTDVRTLGTVSTAAASRVRGLGRAASDATGRLNRLAAQTGRSAAGMRRLAAEIRDVERRLAALDQDIRIAIRLDDGTGGAAVALQQVQDVAQDTARVLRTLRGRAAAAAAEFGDLRSQALLAAGALRSFNTSARTADRRMETLDTRTRTLSASVGDLDGNLARAASRLGAIRGTMGAASRSTGTLTARSRQLLVVAGMLSTALLPIAAATAPIAAGLVAAGAGVGVFAVAIAGQIKALTDVVEAQTKYDDAVREHGRTSPEAAKAELEQLKVLKEVSPATREAAAAYAALTDDYKAFSSELAGDTMPVATKTFAVFSSLLDRSRPLAKGAAREVNRFMTIVAGGLETDAFNDFMDDFTVFSVETLARANSALIRFGRAMATGEGGGDLREFLAYARANGPAVADTLGELARVLLKVLAAGSEVGVSVLTVVNAFAQLVNAIPTDVLATLLQVAFALKAIQIAGLALGAVGPGMALLAANTNRFVRAARFGGVASAIAGVTQQLTLMQRASAVIAVLALVVMGVSELADAAKGAPPEVDKLTTSLKNLGAAGQFSGELQKTFGDMDGLVAKIGDLGKARKELDDYISRNSIGVGWLDDVRRDVRTFVDELVDGEKSLSALQDDFKGLDDAMAQLVTSGHGELAAQNFKTIADAAKAQGYTLKDVQALMPNYQAAVAGLKAEQELTARAMGLFGRQALDTKSKLDAQKASADGLRQSIQALNETNRSALGGQIAFEQAIDDAAEAAKKNAGALTMTDGKLDLNSQRARDAAAALQELGAKTDEATAAARDAGAPWSQVIATYERGRTQFINTAIAMGLSRTQAAALAQQLLDIPDEKTTRIEMDRADALAGLDEVIAKIQATPGAKSVTVSALTADAMALLHNLGYKTETLPDGQVRVTAETGAALSGIGAVQAARDRLEDRTITITVQTTYLNRTKWDTDGNGIPNSVQAPQARGSVLDFYADGGVRRENHVAQIAPAGAWRVWAEDETGGESYIPLHPSKRPRSRAIAEETVRRLGGDPSTIQWNAAGSVTDWRYAPSTGSLFSASESGQAGHRTRKVKGKEVGYFDLGTVERSLRSASRATQAWNRDLQKVADRVGVDVADALAAMGKDGVALTKKMANGSTKYLNDMAGALRGLASTAKASLTDYTRQLGKATAADERFAQNLATLAARGYGDLARQLAAQGDQTAMDLAATAVADRGKAGAANTAAKRANTALTGEEVQQLVAVIAAITTNRTGIHDVAATTGLGEDTIIDIATRASGQIKNSLGSRAAKFLADLARASKGMSYANGGIREGIYATKGGAVTFAEPSTGGEAYVPLGAHKRARAVPVLAEAARRHGLGLTDMRSAQQVVVVREAGDTFHMTIPAVRTGASAAEISAAFESRIRRARRGGVAQR